MKTLALLLLSLAVVLGVPTFPPGMLQTTILNKDQIGLLGDLLPVQGGAVVDNPMQQVRLGSDEHQEELAPVPGDIELSQNKVALDVKEKPDTGVDQEGGVKTEVKKENQAEAQLKPEPNVGAESEVKEEQQGKDNQDTEVEHEPEQESEVRPVSEVKVEPEGLLDLEANVQPELMADPQIDAIQDNEMGHELQDDSERKLGPEVMSELDVHVNPEVEIERKPEDIPDFKVDSEDKVDLNTLENELKSMFKGYEEVEEKFQVKMTLEKQTDKEFSERHTGMEEKHELMDGTIMELEPVSDNYMFGDELTNTGTEKSSSEAPEGEELVIAPYEETIMELEPEMKQKQIVPDAAVIEEGPALDVMGQPVQSLEEYVPNKEAIVRMEAEDMSGYTMTMDAMSQSVQQGELSPLVGLSPEVPAMDNNVVSDVGTGIEPRGEMRNKVKSAKGFPVRPGKQATRGDCYGVVLEGKCYRFFKGPLRAESAEFYCQSHFTGGHLASITSAFVHRELMNMMLQQNGAYTRTWVGGLRYLNTGRFIWLDGSHWGYADWLAGEPNNTSDLEDCVEILAYGNGKFNDFTCWEPQAFICSYPYQ